MICSAHKIEYDDDDKKVHERSNRCTNEQESTRSYVLSWKSCMYYCIQLIIIIILVHNVSQVFKSHKDSAKTNTEKAWSILKEDLHLLHVPPISRDEYLDRQMTLCHALNEDAYDALVSEPSATTLYYTNITNYELSERPFLVLITADCQVTFLAPKFEIGRIEQIPVVAESVRIIEWEETESPYKALTRQLPLGKVMVDDAMRYMIVHGLSEQDITVSPMSSAVRSIRATKSPDEIRILRAINTFTLALIRAVQKTLKVGTRRADLERTIETLFVRAGLGAGFWSIVLFGAQAASPHGGNAGTTTDILKNGEFVLIDTGSTLHGYGSDVTRTILPNTSVVSETLWDAWQLVHDSQSAAIHQMSINTTCSSVDESSRQVIRRGGWGEYYTHRLGHGLGLEMHEDPYLNGANHDLLQSGNVVTNEPGIYVTTRQAEESGIEVGFGIRIEDPILVTEEGPALMTGCRAKSPYQP